MPRLLNDKPCEVTFFDRISDSRITLTYRLPTTDERVGFANALVTRQGNKVKSSMGEARLKYGLKILVGIRDGDFETDKGPLSSNPASPHYDPAWKVFIRDYAQDVVQMLTVHVFESSVVSDEADDVLEGEDKGDKTESPL